MNQNSMFENCKRNGILWIRISNESFLGTQPTIIWCLCGILFQRNVSKYQQFSRMYAYILFNFKHVPFSFVNSIRKFIFFFSHSFNIYFMSNVQFYWLLFASTLNHFDNNNNVCVTFCPFSFLEPKRQHLQEYIYYCIYFRRYENEKKKRKKTKKGKIQYK